MDTTQDLRVQVERLVQDLYDQERETLKAALRQREQILWERFERDHNAQAREQHVARVLAAKSGGTNG